jgi:hypothetical protein
LLFLAFAVPTGLGGFFWRAVAAGQWGSLGPGGFALEVGLHAAYAYGVAWFMLSCWRRTSWHRRRAARR